MTNKELIKHSRILRAEASNLLYKEGLLPLFRHADPTAILRIKHAIDQRPDYRGDVYNSMAIYHAVLNDKVSTLEQFNQWIERNTNANT